MLDGRQVTQLDSSRKCSTAGHNRRKVTSCFCCGLRAAVLPRCYKIQKYVHSKERKPGAAHFWWKCTTFISEEGWKIFRSTKRHQLKVKRLNACKCAGDRKTSALRVCQKPQTAGENKIIRALLLWALDHNFSHLMHGGHSDTAPLCI